MLGQLELVFCPINKWHSYFCEYGHLLCTMEVSMALGRPKATFVLDSERREPLQCLASSRSVPAGLVCRAKIVLLSAAGKTNGEMARQLERSKTTVGLWRGRFLKQGVSEL
jgi:putative transposase